MRTVRHPLSIGLVALAGALSVGVGLMPTTARAYFSTIDTGDLVAPDHYRASLEPQLILNNYNGGNLVGRFDTGIDQNSSIRGILGFGTVQYQAGALYKFVPFPDSGQQPAIGGEAGVVFAQINGVSEIDIRFHPLISKAFDTKYGGITPYASLPIGITSRPSETFIPVQLAGGAEFHPDRLKDMRFYGEMGVNLNRAFSYISVAAAYDFDDATLGAHRPPKSTK